MHDAATIGISAALVLAANLWIASCYSRLPIGQDEGIWLLWGTTGARPYLDHVDCKPPGVHVWGWLLARIARGDIATMKWLHHATIGLFAAAIVVATSSLEAGLAFTTLTHSVRVFGNHAWVEQLSAGFLALGLLSPSIPSAGFLWIACGFNAKLAAPALLWLVLERRWLGLSAFIALGLGTAALVFALSPTLSRAIWYGAVTVPKRMVAWRKSIGESILPRIDLDLANALMVTMPLTILAIVSRPTLALWAPAALYGLVNLAGRSWRPYHFVPLAAFASVAEPHLAWVIFLADWVAAAGYRGDVIARARPSVARRMHQARQVGAHVRRLPGRLWVIEEFTQIYVYAGKRPASRIVEQVEIRHVIDDRRAQVPFDAADLVVLGPHTPDLWPQDFTTELVLGPFTVVSLPRPAPASLTRGLS
jgi:hypothetical protein